MKMLNFEFRNVCGYAVGISNSMTSDHKNHDTIFNRNPRSQSKINKHIDVKMHLNYDQYSCLPCPRHSTCN